MSTKPIPSNHPVQQLFWGLTQSSFEQVGLPDPDLINYVSSLLVDFIHAENLYRVRDAQGRPLAYLFELQLESQCGDLIHARKIQKHLGDYALYIVGLFPESLNRQRRAVTPEYYISQGKQAYATVSEIDCPRPSTILFRKLALHFETCVGALHAEREFIWDSFYQYLMRQMAE